MALSDDYVFDPEQIYRNLTAAGEDWADKKAAYGALDASTKSVLADVTGRYLDGKTSKAEAEIRALSSSDYRNHLASVAKARTEWLRSEVKYDSLKTLADMRRSQESTRRAEISLR